MNKRRIHRIARAIHPRRIPVLAAFLLKDEAISGKLILGATALALLLANTSFGSAYEAFWHLPLSIGIGDFILSRDLLHWVNEGLMTLFFLMVGLEIKREFVHGELNRPKTASLPIAAAIGGMIAPALIFIMLNHGLETARGVAIPIATDIAFAVGLLALIGRKVPPSLKLFLLTLAIVDDIGAVAVIALFYSSDINTGALALAGLLVLSTVVLHRLHRLSMPTYIAIGIVLWLAIEQAGIHASISGAILGFLAPVVTQRHDTAVLADRVEKYVIPLATLIIIPLFAFANTGVSLSLSGFSGANLPLAGGIFFGLIIGKVVGIVAVSWLMVRFGFSKLPFGTSWSQIAGVGLLAGIGFTVSIFVTDLAFAGSETLSNISKLSIFAASAASGSIGLIVLQFMTSKNHLPTN